MHRMGALLYHYVSPLTNYAIQRESDKKMICEIGEGGGQAEEVQCSGQGFATAVTRVALYTGLD